MPILTPGHRYARCMLDVTRLRVIDAVARLGSVTAAAKELHYTQPTISHHLARLEAETGAQLRAAGRARHPAHLRRPAAGRAGRRDHRADRRRRRRARRARRADRRAGAPGQLLLRDRLARPAGAGAAEREASRPAGRPDRHPATRGAGAAARRQDRRRAHLPLRRHGARAGGRPPAPPVRRSAVPVVQQAGTRSPRCATPPGSPAATAAAAISLPCAPTRGSNRRSATRPRTWS